MTAELLHPSSPADVAETMREATATGTRVLVVGGRTHVDKGNPSEVDAELWTTQLDQVVAYEPAEMLVVVGAGIRVSELAAVLAEHGQEWPADAPPGSTVGGVIAAGASSARRQRIGALRDTVVEMHLVTGDGRLVASGARTVKNVTGYDVHRLLTGSLGTLGVITQVALKVRPLPEARRTLLAPGDPSAASALAAAVPLAAGVLATADGVEIGLEGWAAEVDELESMVREACPDATAAGSEAFPRAPWWTWPDGGTTAEVAVAPSRLPEAVGDATRFGALAGIGLGWIHVGSPDELEALRRRVGDLEGIAPAIRGPGGLGEAAPAAPDVQERLRRAFDPAGVLAPGRSW
jgi:glycolate oxidase FAD binding subunit